MFSDALPKAHSRYVDHFKSDINYLFLKWACYLGHTEELAAILNQAVDANRPLKDREIGEKLEPVIRRHNG